MEPKIGMANSGTEVFLFGKHFSNITNPDYSRCKWSMIENTSGEKRPDII